MARAQPVPCTLAAAVALRWHREVVRKHQKTTGGLTSTLSITAGIDPTGLSLLKRTALLKVSNPILYKVYEVVVCPGDEDGAITSSSVSEFFCQGRMPWQSGPFIEVWRWP